ncbi:helix-turn-helix domain-containing protein [Vibrio sp. 10N.222.54.F12]|uniref:helix-turn-helix domain-containing protein n=1 Tax=Vibrio TaxID=662 RepID=UPI000C81CCEB|nr:MULTISPECIES: helix-turn-helix domain-containing protein [Vibrio]MDH5887684.1 helix-turn-helix domain-containing protein [Vibrio splendidus]PML12956.1 hypothetical protein BCT83_19935 [Vibrio tasmaniensis]RIH72849.1 hypothetical protein BJG01_11200 [Vibrio splendidus]URM16396.1 helix-turn-helix domain-containing protein [Vibrio splendidus]
MKKRLNPNLAKIHRSYTVGEVAELYKVDKRTVRNWIKDGLPVFDEVRPLLVLGTDLRLFIRQRRIGNKRKCKSSELYCFKCRSPRKPALETANFIQLKSGHGRVFAKCCECGSKINKYFSWRQLDLIRKGLQVETTASTKTHN